MEILNIRFKRQVIFHLFYSIMIKKKKKENCWERIAEIEEDVAAWNLKEPQKKKSSSNRESIADYI